MCLKRSTSILNLYGDRIFRVDPCMKKTLIRLRDNGVKTLACCCGHDRYPMTVVCNSLTGPFEFYSGVDLPHKRKFYVKDSDGFYYIPEISAPIKEDSG